MSAWDDFVQGIRKKVATSIQGFDYEQDWFTVAKRFLTGAGIDDEWVGDLVERVYPTALSSGEIKPWEEGDLLKGRKPPQRVAERIDMMLLGANQPQKYGTLKESSHIPSKGADEGDKFYTFKDRNQIETVFEGLKGKLSKMKKNVSYNVGYVSDVKKGDASFVNPGIVGLERYQISKGEDDVGKYMAIYDKWDIEPGFGETADKLVGKVMPGFEVYDRRYYEFKDPKPLKMRKIEDDIMKYLNKV